MVRIAGFDDAEALVASGRLTGATIDALLRVPYDDPANGDAAIYALSFAKIRRRHVHRVVLSLIAILEDQQLDGAIRAQAPEGIGVRVPDKQRALRRIAVTSLRRHLRDACPEARFWSAFGLALLGAREARHDLRLLRRDRTVVAGWWTVGEEASDALDTIEGRDPPDRPGSAPLNASQHGNN